MNVSSPIPMLAVAYGTAEYEFGNFCQSSLFTRTLLKYDSDQARHRACLFRRFRHRSGTDGITDRAPHADPFVDVAMLQDFVAKTFHHVVADDHVEACVGIGQLDAGRSLEPAAVLDLAGVLHVHDIDAAVQHGMGGGLVVDAVGTDPVSSVARACRQTYK